MTQAGGRSFSKTVLCVQLFSTFYATPVWLVNGSIALLLDLIMVL